MGAGRPSPPAVLRRLSLFTRLPTPGAVKTRLVPPLTADRAAALQAAMSEDLLERFAREYRADDPRPERPGGPSLEVRMDGDPPYGGLHVPAAWFPSPQGDGDLGARLARAARDARRDGIGRLVIVGADAPLLPLPLVEAAFSGLAERDVLLAPAEDGGYVLIGLALDRLTRPVVAGLFAGIPWGTGAVHEATAGAARRAGLAFGKLAGHWDVDRPEDLPRLAAAIGAAPAPERPRRTAAVLGAAGY